MAKAMEGIFVAANTPRRTQTQGVDLGATLELIDFLCASGVDGIALLGTTGEFVHFSLEDREHMVHLAAKRSRVPLLANVSYSTLDGAIELGRSAVRAGVDGVMLMPPYYFHHSQDSIRAFYRAFAAEIGKATPIYIYNIPVCTNGIDIAVATELLGSGLFAGIKDSSGDLEYFRALHEQSEKTPFTLFAGHERIYIQCRNIGAKGIISGVASALPELMVALDRAWKSGEQEKCNRLEALLNEFLDRQQAFSWPTGVKQAAKQRKLKPGGMAAPLGPEGERRLAEFGEWFDGWLPGVLRECGRS